MKKNTKGRTGARSCLSLLCGCAPFLLGPPAGSSAVAATPHSRTSGTKIQSSDRFLLPLVTLIPDSLKRSILLFKICFFCSLTQYIFPSAPIRFMVDLRTMWYLPDANPQVHVLVKFRFFSGADDRLVHPVWPDSGQLRCGSAAASFFPKILGFSRKKFLAPSLLSGLRWHSDVQAFLQFGGKYRAFRHMVWAVDVDIMYN